MKKKLLLILNPFAGQKKAKRLLSDLVNLFQSHGYEVLVHLTQSSGDGSTAARELGLCVSGEYQCAQAQAHAEQHGNQFLHD